MAICFCIQKYLEKNYIYNLLYGEWEIYPKIIQRLSMTENYKWSEDKYVLFLQISCELNIIS